jgi:hypothetical protein
LSKVTSEEEWSVTQPVEKLSTGITEKIGEAFQTMKNVVCAEENFFFLIRCPPIMLKIFFSHWRLFKKKNNSDVAISGDDWP